MSVIARIALISAFLVLMIGCSQTPTEVPDCVNTSDSTMVCGDTQFTIY